MAEEAKKISNILPHDDEAEQSVIGSMIMDREAITIASGFLTKDDFYSKSYQTLFEAIMELDARGQAVDVVTLQNRLREKQAAPNITSAAYIGDLVAAVPTSANAQYYARIVREKSILRQLIHASQDIEKTCYEEKKDMDQILEETEKQIFGLLQRGAADDVVSVRDLVLSAIERIDASSKGQGVVTGLATGFPDMDYQLAGLQPSDLILLAARPSMGKTALALSIAEYVAIHENNPVAIFSLEMSREQLVNRLLAMESRVDSRLIRNGNLTDKDWSHLIEGSSKVAEAPIFIDDTPGISVSELRSKCRKLKLEHDIQLVVVDYLQLMSGARRMDNRQQEISDISRGLKQIARELNVPVLALSQLSRQVEQRPDRRPMLSDLRESGAIEQDADVVMFIYREAYYNKDTLDKGIAEINIAKQRNGPVGSFNLAWLEQYTRFASSEKQKDRGGDT